MPEACWHSTLEVLSAVSEKLLVGRGPVGCFIPEQSLNFTRRLFLGTFSHQSWVCRALKRPPTAKPAPAPHRTRTLAKTPAQHARKTPPTRRNEARQNKQRKADPGSSWWNSSRNKVSRRKSAGERPVRPHCCRRAARSRRELEGKERNALWDIHPALFDPN